MFTVVGFYGAPGVVDDFRYIPPLADQHIRVEGNNVIVPGEMAHLLGVFAVGAHASRVRIESPSLRRTLLLDVSPVSRIDSRIRSLCWHRMFNSPIPLDPSEPLRFLGMNTGTATSPIFGLVFLGDGPQTEMTGEVYSVRCAPVVVTVPGVWASYPLFLEQTLPAGRYVCVGARAEGNNLLAARFIFVGQAWRPGVIGLINVDDLEWEGFRRGGLGVWGEFTHDQPPVLEVFSTATGTVHVHLDLVRVS